VKLEKFKRAECIPDGIRVENPVGIETEAFPPGWDADQEYPPRRENPAQLLGSAKIPLWINWIAVSSESDMFQYVEATDASDRIVSEGQVQDRTTQEMEIIYLVWKRSQVDILYAAKREDMTNEAIDSGADIDMILYIVGV
jgi:hypothetical protein